MNHYLKTAQMALESAQEYWDNSDKSNKLMVFVFTCNANKLLEYAADAINKGELTELVSEYEKLKDRIRKESKELGVIRE